MSLAEEIQYSERVKRVVGVRLGLLSPERILAQSVAEIYRPIPGSASDPKDGTLQDPRLGTNDKKETNRVSDLNYHYDPGNFGHLNLAKPVIQAKQYEQIIKTLNMVCYQCSHILVNVDLTDPDLDENYRVARSKLLNDIRVKKGRHRFKFVKELAVKISECPNCGQAQPKFTKGRDKSIIYQIVAAFPEDKENKVTYNPEVIHHILGRITDEHCLLMGYDPTFCRPNWMIWTVMPIPPPTVRPSIKLENGQQAEDDLTHILNRIIEANVGLTRSLDKKDKEKIIMEKWALLQLNIAAYIDNEQSSVSTVTNRSNKPLRTLRSRVKAKKGRVRSNLMGKRVDYSSRTVITADPNLSIDELGIPLKVAMTLDVKVTVTYFNITVLTKLVRRGPEQFPGANKIRRWNSDRNNWSTINLGYLDEQRRNQYQLRVGDVVHRHLMDGDWVLFNRQPSLHKLSMMAHRAKVLHKGDTFRLNVSVTTPYGAD